MLKLIPLAYLQKITTVKAPYLVSQPQSIRWLIERIKKNEDEKSKKAIILYQRLMENDSILSRRSSLVDYTSENKNDFSLFKDDGSYPWHSPSLEKRMEIFKTASMEMTEMAFSEVSKAPKHLLEISCTGYFAPYASQLMLMQKGWQNDTNLIKIGHMGCYASVPSLYLGAHLCQSLSYDDKVMLLSTELCSLHLDPLATDPDQVVANILFSDGCAQMELGLMKTPNSLAILYHYETLIPGSTEYMKWELGGSRFSMTLSRKVVTQINAVIEEQLDIFLKKCGMLKHEIKYFAVHPGGPKIIEAIAKKLSLSETSVSHSKGVLKKYGNMSSATLPHIWKEMMEDNSVMSGDYIVSMAFGPGLTVTMNLMKKG